MSEVNNEEHQSYPYSLQNKEKMYKSTFQHNIWNVFHSSCIAFYGVYGLLCMFAYRPYSKYIYFRGRWNEFHETDRVFEYFAFGAGECCIVMAVLAMFCNLALHPDKTKANDLTYLTKLYLLFQICCWIMWTLTEFYYTYYCIEWPVIGCVHVVLCLIVLSMSIKCYSEVKAKVN